MIKKILVTLIGFLLGLGVTTYVMVKNHKSVPPPVGEHPDSVKLAASDSGHKSAPIAAAIDSVKPKPDSTAEQVAPPLAAQLPTAVLNQPPEGAAAAAHNAIATVDPAAKAAAYKSVARIFASMKPAEAAQVLGLLNDSEVEGILRAVGPKQAGDFLGNLPRERAAALSRRLLVPKPDSGVGK